MAVLLVLQVEQLVQPFYLLFPELVLVSRFSTNSMATHVREDITSVGSTENVPETAGGFSGGGFSDVFAIPSYQSASVASYLAKLGTTNSDLYNATGRGFPGLFSV